jgi:hypothetical protein
LSSCGPGGITKWHRSTSPSADDAAAGAVPVTLGKTRVQLANDWNTLVRLDTVKLFEPRVEKLYPEIDLERLQIEAEAGSAGDFHNAILLASPSTLRRTFWGWVGILVDFPNEMDDLTDTETAQNFTLRALLMRLDRRRDSRGERTSRRHRLW